MAGDAMSLMKVIVLGFAAVVAVISTALPAWFTFTIPISWDGGRTIQDKSISVGLFFMENGKILQTDLILVDKAGNANTTPGLYKLAQLFYGLGSLGSLLCFATSILYHVQRFTSATGAICLSGAIMPCSISLVLGVVFAIIGTIGSPGQVWESFPVPDNYVNLQAYPDIQIGIVFYVAAAAALVSLAAAFISWAQACALCKDLEKARYRMLHAPLTDDERGVSSTPGTIYKFPQRNVGFRYDGYSKPSAEVGF